MKRLPDEDFENRVRVATVSFHKEAKLQFPFGTLKEKSAVLDALFNIEVSTPAVHSHAKHIPILSDGLLIIRLCVGLITVVLTMLSLENLAHCWKHFSCKRRTAWHR